MSRNAPPNLPVTHAGLSILLALVALRKMALRLMRIWPSRPRLRTRITLSRGGVLAVRIPRRLRTVCRKGTLWITQPGDAADFILAATQQYRSPARRKIVIQAIDDAELTLHID